MCRSGGKTRSWWSNSLGAVSGKRPANPRELQTIFLPKLFREVVKASESLPPPLKLQMNTDTTNSVLNVELPSDKQQRGT